MPGVLKGGSTGEEYLAMLAFASIVSKSRYYDDEFHACYEELKRALKKGLVQLVPKMSLLCCDNLYQRVTAGTKDTIPFDCNQFFNAYPGKAVYDDRGSRNRENHRCQDAGPDFRTSLLRIYLRTWNG